MIVAFTTSSPMAGVALIEQGRVVASGSAMAPTRAGGGCLDLLRECLNQAEIGLEEVCGFVADLGPGSFTGVKVGVTLAKTLAYALGVPAGGASAFDLMGPGTAAVPARRGQWLLRREGGEPTLSDFQGIEGASAYGDGVAAPKYPEAGGFARLNLTMDRPELLVPSYVLAPSISVPKRPGVLP